MKRSLLTFLWILFTATVSPAQNNSALAPQALPGLNLQVRGGTILLGTSSTGISTQTVALTNNATNYVFLTTGGAIQTNTTGFTGTVLQIATVVTSQGQITSIQDNRPDFIFNGSGLPAGGVTGQVVTNTTPGAGTWQSQGLLDGNGGSPVTTTPYTVQCDSGAAIIDRLHIIRLQSGASVITNPQSTASGCGGGFEYSIVDDGAGTITVNRTGGDTFSVMNGVVNTDGATSFTLGNGQFATVNNGAGTVWEVRISTSSTAWSSLTNPTGNMLLSMGSNLTEFDYTTALSNAFRWANTTAATVSTPQSGPLMQLSCGTEWTGAGASTQGCLNAQFVPASGLNPQTGIKFTYSGSNTNGFMYYSFDKIIAAGTNQAFYIGDPTGNIQNYLNATSLSLNATTPIRWSNSNSYANQGSVDLGVSRDSAGIIDFGNGTQGDATGFTRSGNTVRLTSNFTTTSASLVTITGLAWTFPATNHNYSFTCQLSYSQATAAAANAFGIQAATTAPTNIYAAMHVDTSLADAGVNATLPTLNTTTATNIGTFTPSAFGAIGTVADIFTAELWGSLEQGAGATTLNIMALTGNASDALTIYRGSSCTLMP